MNTFTAEDTPAQIVKIFPQASDLFKERKIDYCCGGDQPLGLYMEDNHLDEENILIELNSSYQKWKDAGNTAKNWGAATFTELIDHIQMKHHSYLYEELPQLQSFVTKIFRVHGSEQPHLKDLYRLFNEFRTELEEHSIKEDHEVFPLIKKYEVHPSESLLQNIKEANGHLEDEHEAVGDLLKQMRKVTNDYTLPENACGSYQITYARLEEMEANTFEHVHLENNILFKQL